MSHQTHRSSGAGVLTERRFRGGDFCCGRQWRLGGDYGGGNLQWSASKRESHTYTPTVYTEFNLTNHTEVVGLVCWLGGGLDVVTSAVAAGGGLKGTSAAATCSEMQIKESHTRTHKWSIQGCISPNTQKTYSNKLVTAWRNCKVFSTLVASTGLESKYSLNSARTYCCYNTK